jgi:hypothetical protein
MLLSAAQKGYRGYITADAIPQNGAPFTAGIAFPMGPVEGQFCLRTDYLPNRLFRFNGTRWVKQEDNVRMTMSNRGSHDGTVNQGLWVAGSTYQKNDLVKFNNSEYVSKVDNNSNVIPSSDVAKWQQLRITQKTSFINNETVSVIDGHNIKDQAALIIMVTKNQINRLKIFTIDDGWAMHCQSAGPTQFFESWGLRRNLASRYGIPKLVDDIVYTADDKIYDMVHQFNRIPEWNELLTKKYE